MLLTAAQDRREMLQAIMRRGTSSLGTDVPSEREINRLAARSEEEFWLFEKMDEERRQRENYRSRLMEEHEVPDWAYSVRSTGEKPIGSLEPDPAKGQIMGKRRRKEVVYTDLLSDLQWIKAVEGGEDLSKLTARGKRKEHVPEANESTSENVEQQKASEVKNESESVASEGTSEDFWNRTPKKLKPDPLDSNRDGVESVGMSSRWNDDFLTWHTRKRRSSSSHGRPSSRPLI